MKIALLTTDGRQHFRDYDNPKPSFGTAPEALLQGFSTLPEIEVHVISCLQRAVQSPRKIADNIWYHGLHVPKIGWLRTLYQGCVRAVRRELKAIQPDIVHGQGTERDCAIGAVFSGYPNVVTIHGNMAELARLFPAPVGSYHWFAARLENFTLPRTAGVFCNSAYTRELVRLRAKKAWFVPNALRCEIFDAPQASPPNSSPCILLNVGAVTQRKRQLELLNAMQNLRRRGFNFELRFIGPLNPSDAYAAAFRDRLKSLEAEGWVRYLGELSTPELIRNFDSAAGLLHFPSEEAFGLVVAEALARNLKFFGSRVGGVPDIIEGVEGAELFPAGDWTAAGNSMARWMETGCPRLVSAAAVMRGRYHPEVIARRHLEIYREVLERQSS
jgi:glycosyltransferase involved in cell wall biosynthesis